MTEPSFSGFAENRFAQRRGEMIDQNRKTGQIPTLKTVDNPRRGHGRIRSRRRRFPWARHFEPWARNPEASMLGADATCSSPPLGISPCGRNDGAKFQWIRRESFRADPSSHGSGIQLLKENRQSRLAQGLLLSRGNGGDAITNALRGPGVANTESGCSSAWPEHCVRDAGVAGSNPVTPTIFPRPKPESSCLA